MKAERLLAILTILLNRKKVTASYLAARFGVSVRTIYRDVDALAGAGLPVFATQGRDGGFELVEGFTISSQVLETGEIEQILTGLRSLKAVQPGPGLDTVIEKFSLALSESGKRGIRTPGGHLFIEFTPSHREKRILAELDASITKRSVLKIAYADAQGTETDRSIEPAALVFMWQSWYVWAWCRLRADFRLFKISRILKTHETDERREAPTTDLQDHPWAREWESAPFEQVSLTADRIARARLGEFFDDECITELADGALRVDATLPVDEWVISFLMSLPGNVRILEPESMRRAILERSQAIARANTPNAAAAPAAIGSR
jgi:predicted DNA-binding transcriptional regulator YafY